MTWLSDRAGALQAASSALTALVAVAALFGVWAQIRAAERLQQGQAARDLYRESLVLAIQNPDLAAPEDGCALLASPRGPAYVAYVDHLFYTAEEAMALDPDWAPVFAEVFRQHTDYLCSAAQDSEGFTVEVLALVMGLSARTCPAAPPCG